MRFNPLVEGSQPEKLSPCQHFKQDRTERVNIGTLVERFAPALFRRHVRRGPDNRASTGQAVRPWILWLFSYRQLLSTINGMGQPKIGDFGDAIVPHQDIG